MPRYHFDIHDGDDFPDDEGIELPDLEAARRTAVRLAGDCLRDHADHFWGGEGWLLDVTDARRTILFTLRFQAELPLVARAQPAAA